MDNEMRTVSAFAVLSPPLSLLRKNKALNKLPIISNKIITMSILISMVVAL
jgi:hypothetical protein